MDPISGILLDANERRLAREIAWGAVESWVRAKRKLALSRAGLVPAGTLLEKRGCYVSLKKEHELRGCMGVPEATRPLWHNLIDRAIEAAARDPRFEPVRPEELEHLSMELSVLTPLEPVSGCSDIQIGRHGILLAKGGARALFLPQVAPEHGWDLETCLERLALKAGLEPDAWKAGCSFKVFEAEVF